jgi:hypothetical protein
MTNEHLTITIQNIVALEDANNNITVAVTPTKVIPMYLKQN